VATNDQQIIVKFTADTSGLQPAIEQMRILGKITDEDAKKISEINAEQQKFNATASNTNSEFAEFHSQIKSLASEIKAGVIEGLAEGMKKTTKETTDTVAKVKSLKTELKELKAQIASGSLGEKEMREATKRAAELTDHLGDVQERIKGLSSDTKRLDAVVTAFRGIAGGVAVASGAMALFGEQNKDLEKGLMKVQGAMALLQGVQELATIATGNSTLKTYALATAQRLAGTSATIMGVEIAASTAVATAGLSLLLVGIAYLATEMDDAGDSAETLAKRMEDSLTLQVKYTDMATKLISDARQRDIKEAENSYLREYRDLEEAYKNKTITQEVFFRDQKILIATFEQNRAEINKKYDDEAVKKKEEANKKEQARLKKIQEEEKKHLDEIAKQKLDADKTLQQKSKELADSEELRVAQSEEEKLLIIKSRKADELKLLYDAGNKTTADKVALDTGLINLEHQFNADVLAAKKAAEDEKAKINKVSLDAQAKDSEDWFEAEIGKQLGYNEQAKKAAEDLKKGLQDALFASAGTLTDTLFTITSQNIKATEDAEIESINKRKEQELNARGVTEAQKIKIEERAQKEIAKTKAKAWRDQQSADIAQAVINGALAITKTFAQLGFPAGLPASIAQAAITIGQVAVIKNTPVPKFAKGTMKVLGEGSGTSDHVPAMLSHGESVFTASTTSDYYPALSTIFDRKVSPQLANDLLTDLASGNFNINPEYHNNTSTTLDYHKLGQIVKQGQSKVVINIDQKGFEHFKENSFGKTQYVNSKFKYEI
jgi:hypothetical protein